MAVPGRAAVVIASLLWWATTAQAQVRAADKASLVARAGAAEQAFEYEEASMLWLELIARDDLDDEERIQANYKAGELARIMGRDVEARMHFVYVLERRPDYAVAASTTPKVRHFFDLVRQEVRGRQPGPGTAAAPVTAAATEPLAPPWLLIAAGASAGASLLAGGVGLTLGLLAQAEHEAAQAEPVQLTSATRYQQRDSLALAANLAYGVGGALLLAGGGLTLADRLTGTDE